MKRLSSLILLVFVVSLASAQRRTITHEDLWSMKRVGAPAVSPDGKWVIFGVIEPSYDEKEQVSDIWIVATDGSSAPRKLTNGKAAESGYTWSPDGKFIAFVAKRDGEDESQIYLLNFQEGGEAQRLTNLSTGAGMPAFSPDGKTMMFSSNVFPKVYSDSVNKKMNEEKKKIKYKARIYTTYPIRDFDKWLDEKQTHLFLQALEPGAKAKDLFAGVAISKLEGFKYFNASWSADSKDIVFAASENAGTGAYQNIGTSLYKMSAAGGDAVRLITDKNDYVSPTLTRDGKYLLASVNGTNVYSVYLLPQLVRFDWPSMQNRTVLAEKLDRPINNMVIKVDNIYASVENEGIDRIYSIPVKGGDAVLLSKGQRGCYTNVSTSAGNDAAIVADFETGSMPPEIVRYNSDGTHTMLSHFNDKLLAQLDLPNAEPAWFTNSKNRKTHSWVVKPAGFDPSKKYPLVVMMHGGPASSSKDNWSYRWNLHLLAKGIYVVVTTDYVGSTGYGEKFARDIQNDPLKGPGEDINEAAANVIKTSPFVDGSRTAAVGGSYGGHLANWMQATTTQYKCLVSHAGLVNAVSQWGTSDVNYSREIMNGNPPWVGSKVWKEQNPFNYAANFKTPILITVGELDYRVPMNNSIENFNILQRQKVPVKLIVFPEENHWILKGEDSRLWYKEVSAWLEKYM